MKQVTMPGEVRGQWIWKSSLSGREDTFLLMRKNFRLDSPGLENTLWISANCSYQLFVNERFAGFGPRANHGLSSYVDRYDITRYLQSGSNTVGVIVYHCPSFRQSRIQVPGLWCQMESDGHPVFCSDHSWQLREAPELTVPRPRAAVNQLMTEYADNRTLPANWSSPMFQPGLEWTTPDRLFRLDEPGAELEIYPLEPATVEALEEFQALDAGRVENGAAWTEVCFGARHRNRLAVCAASTWLFSAAEQEVPVRLYADDPFRFFCNRTLVAGAERVAGEHLHMLSLKKGWNRLLLAQTPGHHSMGFFLLFPGLQPEELATYREPDEKAGRGWKVAGPLKLPLHDTTPSLRLRNLEIGTYVPDSDNPVDVSSVLRAARLNVTGPVPESRVLHAGEFFRYRLDILRYGFPVLELEASQGDVIDVTLGYRLGENGLPSRGKHVRATHTFRCRQGMNRFMLFNPREGLFLMVSVRQAAGEVRIINCGFEELVRMPTRETLFSSSDETLNLLWKIGVHTLRRSSAFIPQVEPFAEYDSYLFDAYIDAVNMVVTFGDHAYAATRLRQFIDAQFENGDIPVLTFGARHRSQVHHLFFLPVWMMYNYRTSGDLEELKRLLPHLELLEDFFLSLVDESLGLMEDIDTRFRLESRLSNGVFGKGSVPTYLNALYCRFLLSAAEAYLAGGNPEAAERSRRQADRIASRLRELNYDPKLRLFVRKTEGGKDFRHSLETDRNLFANFSALQSGVMGAEDFEHFFFTFFRYEPPFDRSEEARNPYFHFLFLETMFALGQGEWTVRYFREYWEKRICKQSGSWLSWRDGEDPAPLRLRDGNALSPNVFLVREIAGVRTADAGHASIYFNPALSQADWVDLLLPTAFGKIRVRWEKKEDGMLDVILDANYPVKVLPEMSAEQLKKTAFALSDNVVLLQPPSRH